VGDNLLEAEVGRSGYRQIDTLSAQEFATEIERVLALYPQPVTEVQFNLLGSHDTPRLRTLARGDTSAYRLATLFQMTYPGAPSIYYGDEIGLEGKHDPGCRGAFPWDEGEWDRDLHDYVRRCIALRRAHPALRQGDFAWLFAGQGVVVYGRRLGDETMVVALNSSRRAVTLSIPVEGYLGDGTLLRDVWSEAVTTVARGRVEGARIRARSGAVLEAIRRSA
jgi:neopullulanase